MRKSVKFGPDLAIGLNHHFNTRPFQHSKSFCQWNVQHQCDKTFKLDTSYEILIECNLFVSPFYRICLLDIRIDVEHTLFSVQMQTMELFLKQINRVENKTWQPNKNAFWQCDKTKWTKHKHNIPTFKTAYVINFFYSSKISLENSFIWYCFGKWVCFLFACGCFFFSSTDCVCIVSCDSHYIGASKTTSIRRFNGENLIFEHQSS